jgi:hypothetical protein
MRHVASVCVLAAGLIGCSNAQQVSSTPPSTSYNPPTVSYQLSSSNDLTEANGKAAAFCQRYNATPRLQSAVGGQAHYQCVGGTATPAAPVAAAPVVVAPPAAAAPAVTNPPTNIPTVSYPIVGNDLSSANVSAVNYCRQYGRNAQLQGVASGTATYSCI